MDDLKVNDDLMRSVRNTADRIIQFEYVRMASIRLEVGRDPRSTDQVLDAALEVNPDVVKSATKKKLTDLGVDEEHAHLLADDRKWDDVKILNPQQIAEICQTDSGTAQSIHTKINPIKSAKEILPQPQRGSESRRGDPPERRHLCLCNPTGRG